MWPTPAGTRSEKILAVGLAPECPFGVQAPARAPQLTYLVDAESRGDSEESSGNGELHFDNLLVESAALDIAIGGGDPRQCEGNLKGALNLGAP